MKFAKTGVVVAALMAVAAPAFANVTMVSCPGYVVSMADDIAIRGISLAGSQIAFEELVCERSSADADGLDAPLISPVFIEELGITTRISLFPMDDD